MKSHHRQIGIGVGVVVAVSALVQSFYPADRLLPYTSIDGLKIGGWEVKDATWELNYQMRQQPIKIHVGKTATAYDMPKPAEIGLTIDNQARVTQHHYPWYAKLLPFSALWWQVVQDDGKPRYTSDERRAKTYLEKKLGASCDIPSHNASIEYKDKKLHIVAGKNGGKCKETEAIAALQQARPLRSQSSTVTIPVDISKPKISDTTAKEMADSIKESSNDGIRLSVAGKQETIAQTSVLSWLDFSTKKNVLSFSINPTRANKYMKKYITPSVTKPSGTTKITTRDFTVIATKTGSTGRTLALSETLAGIKAILEGEESSSEVVTTALPPKVVYSRSYTHTSNGIAALVTQYDKDHAGVFGVTFQELEGAGRSASYNGSKRFTTASTYKLFVAYGTLRKVDAGTWKWTDKNISGGRTLSTCFNDMIVKSDNACGEVLLKKLGLTKLTSDIHALGLTNSGFTQAATPQTTADDLALFLNKLQNGNLPIKSASRARMLDAMKRQVYRQGIPAGARSAVADKVGFLGSLLHDAAIVYSPKGTYVLVVMTDGSAWASIADLTSKIESLR
jgi:beta-lactamase class A